MNETLRRELARLREHNQTPTSVTFQRRPSKRRRQDDDIPHYDSFTARLPDVTHHVPFRNDTRVDMVSHENLQDQITALREEVKSLRAALQRTFRLGLNSFQTPV